MPSAKLNIPMFMVATNIEISNLSNGCWPKWANIINSDVSRQPDHEWLKPSSSTWHVSMDSDTPKGIRSMDATLASMEEGWSKTSIMPMHVRPPGSGKIKTATTGDKVERNPGPSHADWKGKHQAVEQGPDEDPQVKLVTMSDDHQQKGNAKVEDTVTRGQMKERTVETEQETESPEQTQGHLLHCEPRKGCNARSKSHVQSQIHGTTDSAQIAEDKENVANDLCSQCQEKAFICIIGRNAACKMCHWSKVRCSHVQQQPPQQARLVGRRDQSKGSKQPTKTSTRKHCQESPPPPSTTTDSANQSGEVLPPPPKCQCQRVSKSQRQPLVAPT